MHIVNKNATKQKNTSKRLKIIWGSEILKDIESRPFKVCVLKLVKRQQKRFYSNYKYIFNICKK